MTKSLKATVINMKSLSQDIVDPVVVGAGEAAGRALRVIFTQEAAAQFSKNTKVYLSWHHLEMDIKGYNVFTEITNPEDKNWPPTWEIKYPKSMLYEGNVVACIQIVDDVSISTSVNFTIHVLIDPNDGSRFTATDDFTEFQNAVIELTNVADDARDQMDQQAQQFEEMQIAFNDVRQVADEAKSISQTAQDIAENALGVSQEALETIVDFTSLAKEIQTQEQSNSEKIQNLEQVVSATSAQTEAISLSITDVARAVREVAEQLGKIKHSCGGLTEEEILELIRQELVGYVSQDDISNYITIEQLANYVTADQLQTYTTDAEVDAKLKTVKEEAEAEHQALWDSLQFVEED